MDRSFLSDNAVIGASRDFVCIRTATYEDKEEAEFLRSTFLGRAGGDLRNFGYCILSPDGKQKLRRSQRGPNFEYLDSAEMARDLERFADQFPAKPSAKASPHRLPQMKSVRLGINVASCDGLPSVVVVGKDQDEVDQWKKQLSAVIWDESLIGKFIYASTTDSADLESVAGAGSKTGILVIRPDPFGLTGELIQAIDKKLSPTALKKALTQAAKKFSRDPKSHGEHVRNGRRSGKSWETEVPVPESRRGRRSGRAQ